MKDKRKNYKKPAVEEINVQWSKCIATGSGANVTIKIDPVKVNSTQIWFGGYGTSWNEEGF